MFFDQVVYPYPVPLENFGYDPDWANRLLDVLTLCLVADAAGHQDCTNLEYAVAHVLSFINDMVGVALGCN